MDSESVKYSIQFKAAQTDDKCVLPGLEGRRWAISPDVWRRVRVWDSGSGESAARAKRAGQQKWLHRSWTAMLLSLHEPFDAADENKTNVKNLTTIYIYIYTLCNQIFCQMPHRLHHWTFTSAALFNTVKVNGWPNLLNLHRLRLPGTKATFWGVNYSFKLHSTSNTAIIWETRLKSFSFHGLLVCMW